MKKHNSMQGTFSRLFGKKHASNNSTSSLFVTNPPWIFTQEVKLDNPTSSGSTDGIYYGDSRFDSVTDSGTATLKARPRVRPLLTFLPLNSQETHGVAVPTPSVPEGFEDKLSPGLSSQINGSYRKYNSVVDLRPKAFEENYLNDDYIPPPPSVPPPPPPSIPPPPPPPPPTLTNLSPSRSSEEAPPPPSMKPLPPPPPPSMVPPPPPPAMPFSSPSALAPPSYRHSNLSSPSTPSPPDFIPPAPPLAFMDVPASPLPHTLSFSNGVSKWKSETVLNLKDPYAIPHRPNFISPTSPFQKESQYTKYDPDPHLTFPRSLKIPPPTPVRTSSISSEEKESGPNDKPFPTMVPHSRPALPSNFTIHTADLFHIEGEPGKTATLEKPSIVVTEAGSPRESSNSNGSSITPGKQNITSLGKTECPADHSLSGGGGDDDNEWKEHVNLNKVKHELSTLLNSSSRKEDRTIVPKTKINLADSNQITTEELKQTKPAQSPLTVKGERRENIAGKISSPSKAITSDGVPTRDSMVLQANCVMKFKDELEAMLSPTRDGGPPPAIANLRHNPETKKQVTLQFGGGQISDESKFPKPITHQNNSASKGAEEYSKTSDISCKPPVSLLKPKKEVFVPAASLPVVSGTVPRVQPASPNVDLSLLQYNAHRTRFGSVDSLASANSSQTTEEGSVSTNNNENPKDPGELKSSVASCLSSNTEPSNNEVLVHPVTGEKVKRGSPMALLLAAQQRAQRGRSSALPSRQNSSLTEKPTFILSGKLHGSSQSENKSSNIYYNDAKPNSVTVIPKPPQRESLAISELLQHNSAMGFSEENNNVHKLTETSESSVPANKYSSPNLAQSFLTSTHVRQNTPTNHTVNNTDEGDEAFGYEIIPPPPEFSNDASMVPEGPSNGEEKLISSDRQASDNSLNLSYPRYDTSKNYFPTSKCTLDIITRPSGSSHHYTDGSYSPSYLSSYSSTRPLIKKRLYMTEDHGSYGRAAMSSRSMSTPNTYGHNTMTYKSQATEGIRRVNSVQRDVPISTQGRRVSLELSGKKVAFNITNDVDYKGQNGEYSSASAAGRPSHGSLPYSGMTNTFTVRPGTRQPISYSYQGGLR